MSANNVEYAKMFGAIACSVVCQSYRKTISGNSKQRKTETGFMTALVPFTGLEIKIRVLLQFQIFRIRYLNEIRGKDRTLIVIDDHTTGVDSYFSQWIKTENKGDILIGKILKQSEKNTHKLLQKLPLEADL